MIKVSLIFFLIILFFGQSYADQHFWRDRPRLITTGTIGVSGSGHVGNTTIPFALANKQDYEIMPFGVLTYPKALGGWGHWNVAVHKPDYNNGQVSFSIDTGAQWSGDFGAEGLSYSIYGIRKEDKNCALPLHPATSKNDCCPYTEFDEKNKKCNAPMSNFEKDSMNKQFACTAGEFNAFELINGALRTWMDDNGFKGALTRYSNSNAMVPFLYFYSWDYNDAMVKFVAKFRERITALENIVKIYKEYAEAKDYSPQTREKVFNEKLLPQLKIADPNFINGKFNSNILDIQGEGWKKIVAVLKDISREYYKGIRDQLKTSTKDLEEALRFALADRYDCYFFDSRKTDANKVHCERHLHLVRNDVGELIGMYSPFILAYDPNKNLAGLKSYSDWSPDSFQELTHSKISDWSKKVRGSRAKFTPLLIRDAYFSKDSKDYLSEDEWKWFATSKDWFFWAYAAMDIDGTLSHRVQMAQILLYGHRGMVRFLTDKILKDNGLKDETTYPPCDPKSPKIGGDEGDKSGGGNDDDDNFWLTGIDFTGDKIKKDGPGPNPDDKKNGDGAVTVPNAVKNVADVNPAFGANFSGLGKGQMNGPVNKASATKGGKMSLYSFSDSKGAVRSAFGRLKKLSEKSTPLTSGSNGQGSGGNSLLGQGGNGATLHGQTGASGTGTGGASGPGAVAAPGSGNGAGDGASAGSGNETLMMNSTGGGHMGGGGSMYGKGGKFGGSGNGSASGGQGANQFHSGNHKDLSENERILQSLQEGKVNYQSDETIFGIITNRYFKSGYKKVLTPNPEGK